MNTALRILLTISLLFYIHRTCHAQSIALTDRDRIEITAIYDKMISGLKDRNFLVLIDCAEEKSLKAYTDTLRMMIDANLEMVGFESFEQQADTTVSDLWELIEIQDPSAFLQAFSQIQNLEFMNSEPSHVLGHTNHKIVSISGEDSTAYIIVEKQYEEPEAETVVSLGVVPVVKSPTGWRIDIETLLTTILRYELQRLKSLNEYKKETQESRLNSVYPEHNDDDVREALTLVKTLDERIQEIKSEATPLLLKLAKKNPQLAANKEIESEWLQLEKYIEVNAEARRTLIQGLAAIDDTLGIDSKRSSIHHQLITEKNISLTGQEYVRFKYLTLLDEQRMIADERRRDIQELEGGKSLIEKYTELSDAIGTARYLIERVQTHRHYSPYDNFSNKEKPDLESSKQNIASLKTQLADAIDQIEVELVKSNPKLAEMNQEIEDVSTKVAQFSESAINNENADLSELQAAIAQKQKLSQEVIRIRAAAFKTAATSVESSDAQPDKLTAITKAIQQKQELQKQLEDQQQILAEQEASLDREKTRALIDEIRGYSDQECEDALVRLNMQEATLNYIFQAPLPYSEEKEK